MKTAVLLSGGVDSSVALHLLKNEKCHDITAFYIKIWLEDEVRFLGNCPWEEDLEYARAVCEEAKVLLKIVSLQREYFDQVVEYALLELKQGRTPSPDIFCNQRIKFGLFQDRIDPDFEKIASGHYAIIRKEGDKTLLLRAPDPVKDQTYFLSQQRKEQLDRSMFPIGHLVKDQVRTLAAEFDLPNKSRKDSQGVCFLGKIKYPDFVRHYLGEKTGSIINRETGETLGEHKGFWFHTIGQRQGLGLSGGPWYVSGKNVVNNTVLVTHGGTAEALGRTDFLVTSPHWINDPPDTERLTVRLRHGPALLPCSVHPSGESDYSISLDTPDRGIAPGQFAVFYNDRICLGAGAITLR
ncbi:MAG: tRNA 2-thiouridine(34) synthase MnmA [Spirochaetales bacterium]|jgi:tRNA (5-methylaminomethyl-2-thiouridylate)-methyltransferase|nr:tRNA 2-thiouridine(34) synthase MnmA [Spirochaetales bacterium]